MGIIICSVSACADKNKKSSEEQTQTEFEQTLEAKDTIAVKELIDQFFTYVKTSRRTEPFLCYIVTTRQKTVRRFR